MRPQQANRLDPASPAPRTVCAAARWRMPYAERPLYIQLETVTKCNARCPFCPQHEIERIPHRMTEETWRRIVDQTRGWGVTYRPFLTNEPFVDRRQPEIVRYIKDNDPTARVEFNTNGELLTEDLGRALLEAGVDIMRFSIDGLSREAYEPSRVGVSYDRVYERVPRFLEIWEREGYRDRVHTEVRIIAVPENRHELDDYRAFWEPRCSEVVETSLYRWPWTGQTAAEVVRKPCLKVLDELFFYTDGNATLCCWDVHGRAVIGNVYEQTVQEIWDGHAARHLRSLLDDGRRDLIHLCSRCDAYAAHDFSRFLARP
ncbi:MAG: radical SAM/SPASM domain-containing protein [Candidatus Krumholzibacteriia bacterium]